MSETVPRPKPVTVIPNIERVLVKLLSHKQINSQANILVPGQLKAGENLLYGEVVREANPYNNDDGVLVKSRFKKGMRIYYSEYSASALTPLGQVERGLMTMGEATNDDNRMYVVAEDDIMAFEVEE